MRTGVDKHKVSSVCVCEKDKCGFAACTLVGEGCVKIMQITTECEIKNWLITPVVSIWLQLQHGNHVPEPGKTRANGNSPEKKHNVLLYS